MPWRCWQKPLLWLVKSLRICENDVVNTDNLSGSEGRGLVGLAYYCSCTRHH